MARQIRTSRPKLSPVQTLKSYIIRVGLAKKVKLRKPRPIPGGQGRETNTAFQFIWHRIALLFLGMMLAGWVALATGAYFFVKHARDFPEVRYVDLVFPHRWDEYRTARGDYYIAQAQEMLEEGQTRGVVHLVRVGVQQSPDNTEGRLLLAQIYSMLGRPDLGIEVLRSRAMEHADDTDYLGALISLLFANHEDSEVEKLANRILDGSTEATERNLILAVAAATANFNRGNYDRAQEIIDKFDLLQSRTGTLLQARIHWEVGESEQAIELLERILTNPGPQEAQVVDYLIEYLWSSGKEARAERVAFVRFMEDPLSFAPRIRLLYIYDKRNDAPKLATEIENYFRLFEREEEAMQPLAQFAASSNRPDLAKRVLETSRTKGHEVVWPSLFLLEAYLGAGQYRPALDFFESIEESVADWTPLQQAHLQPLLAGLHLGAGNTERGETALNEVLVRGEANPASLTSLSERLIEMGEYTHAREILHHVHRNQPSNQEALSRLIRLDIARGNNDQIVPNLVRLLEMRKPSQELLQEAHRHISSDLFIFQPQRAEILESLDAALVRQPPQAS